MRVYSEEIKQQIRRKRLAKRLMKQQPLFAFAIMCDKYTGYTHEQFQKDLKKSKSKSLRKKKSALSLNLKYQWFMKLYRQYKNGNEDVLPRLLSLSRNYRKPFIFRVGKFDYRLRNNISEHGLERLVSLMNKPEEFDREFKKMNSYGN